VSGGGCDSGRWGRAGSKPGQGRVQGRRRNTTPKWEGAVGFWHSSVGHIRKGSAVAVFFGRPDRGWFTAEVAHGRWPACRELVGCKVRTVTRVWPKPVLPGHHAQRKLCFGIDRYEILRGSNRFYLWGRKRCRWQVMGAVGRLSALAWGLGGHGEQGPGRRVVCPQFPRSAGRENTIRGVTWPVRGREGASRGGQAGSRSTMTNKWHTGSFRWYWGAGRSSSVSSRVGFRPHSGEKPEARQVVDRRGGRWG